MNVPLKWIFSVIASILALVIGITGARMIARSHTK